MKCIFIILFTIFMGYSVVFPIGVQLPKELKGVWYEVAISVGEEGIRMHENAKHLLTIFDKYIIVYFDDNDGQRRNTIRLTINSYKKFTYQKENFVMVAFDEIEDVWLFRFINKEKTTVALVSYSKKNVHKVSYVLRLANTN